MIFGYNEKILSFGSYLSNAIGAGTKHYFKLLLTYIITALFILLGIGIFVGIFYLAGSRYLPVELLGNPQLIFEYTLVDYAWLLETLRPAMTALIPGLVLCWFLISFAVNIAQCSLYLIVDAYVKGVKRKMGSILGYAFKRSVPVIGSRIWRGLYLSMYTFLFVLLSRVLLSLAGLESIQELFSLSNIFDNWVSYALIALSALYIVILVALSVAYNFTPFIRMRYKVHGIKSMKLSRKLAKGKKGKIFFNILLYTIFMGVLLGLLAFGMVRAWENNMQLTPLLFGLLVLYIAVYLPLFRVVMYTNFELARGRYALSSLKRLPQCPQDKCFDAEDRRMIALKRGKVPTQEIFAMPPVQLRKNKQGTAEPKDDPLADKMVDVLKPMGIEPDAIGKPEKPPVRLEQLVFKAEMQKPSETESGRREQASEKQLESKPVAVAAVAQPPKAAAAVKKRSIESVLSEVVMLEKEHEEVELPEIKLQPIVVKSEHEIKRGKLSETLRESLYIEELDEIEDLD